MNETRKIKLHNQENIEELANEKNDELCLVLAKMLAELNIVEEKQ